MSTAHRRAHPLLTVSYRDPQGGWEGVLVIDSIVEGATIGGVRVTPTVHAGEVARLARSMTLKTSAIGLPVGGAKVGIRYDPGASTKREAMTRFFAHVRPMCEAWYAFGPDMNTSSRELDEVATRAGIAWRLGALASAADHERLRQRLHHAMDLPIGPFTVETLRTGAGVAAAVERAAHCMRLRGPLRVAVQGFGVVGSAAAWSLCQRGHCLVAAADVGGSYSHPDGLDVSTLMAARRADGLIEAEALPGWVRRSMAEDVLYSDVDVLVLAAIPDTIHEGNSERVRARLIVEGANIPITAQAAARLHARGIQVVPDYIASGGAVAMGVGVIRSGFPHGDAGQLIGTIESLIAGATERAFHKAADTGLTMRQALMPDIGEVDA
jgi:glutamate dehydrogenase (NAD(P)+)